VPEALDRRGRTSNLSTQTTNEISAPRFLAKTEIEIIHRLFQNYRL
jgi:hypothetical protein